MCKGIQNKNENVLMSEFLRVFKITKKTYCDSSGGNRVDSTCQDYLPQNPWNPS